MIKQTSMHVLIGLILLANFLGCEAQNNQERKDKEATTIDIEKNEVYIKEINNNTINEIFTKQVKEKLHLQNCIKKVFEYKDLSGDNYLITTQSDCENINSKAIQFIILKKNELKIIRRVKDFILTEKNVNNNESNIFIWHKYLTVGDIDKDGFVDLILVYGTTGENGFEDNRVKQLIIYKGNKIAIRHQNAVLDDERFTQIDETFYHLPFSIKKCIQSNIIKMIDDKLALYNSDVLKKICQY